MTRVREGELEKLGILFERYQKLLLNFFASFTRDLQAREDLVQDVFVRILKYRHTFGAKSKFSAWIYQIARNTHIKQWRRREREVLLDDDEQRSEVVSDDPTPDQTLEQQQAVRLLHEALARLPQEKRELLMLSRIHELKHREIAARLRCEVGTVKVRLFRAIREVGQVYCKLAGEKRT